MDLGTEKAPGTKLAKSNFQFSSSNFLFLKTEGHVFSNPLYYMENTNMTFFNSRFMLPASPRFQPAVVLAVRLSAGNPGTL